MGSVSGNLKQCTYPQHMVPSGRNQQLLMDFIIGVRMVQTTAVNMPPLQPLVQVYL